MRRGRVWWGGEKNLSWRVRPGPAKTGTFWLRTANPSRDDQTRSRQNLKCTVGMLQRSTQTDRQTQSPRRLGLWPQTTAMRTAGRGEGGPAAGSAERTRGLPGAEGGGSAGPGPGPSRPTLPPPRPAPPAATLRTPRALGRVSRLT